MECRKKSIHSRGNVGMAEWVSVGDHGYTGVFEGGDTGFVRLSSVNSVDLNPDDEFVMKPSMGLKFLRDGVDSANALANMNIPGQRSYNFFKYDLRSSLIADVANFELSKVGA